MTQTLDKLVAPPVVPMRRNSFFNSGMRISQEFADAVVTLNPGGVVYVVDGLDVTLNLGAGRMNAQRLTLRTPAGSSKRVRATTTTAQAAMAAGNFAFFEHLIEGIDAALFGWGTPQARPAVIRHGLNLPAGQYCLSVRNVPATISYTVPIVVSPAEAGQEIVRTFVVPAPPNDIPGVIWGADNNAAISVSLCYACGSTFASNGAGWAAGNFVAIAGQTNLLATAGAYAEIFDVGFFLGADVPTLFELAPLLEEEGRCRRYYQRGTFSVLGNCRAAGEYMSVMVSLLDSMRAVPSVGLNVTFQSVGVVERVTSVLGAAAFRVHISANAAGSYESTGDFAASARL